MTSKERVKRILDKQSFDRPAACESFWAETDVKWREEGHLAKDENIYDHFDLDIRGMGWPNMLADPTKQPEIVEESDEWITRRNSNGAVLKYWKNHSGTPEHIDFAVKDRQTWEELVRPQLLDGSFLEKRVSFEAYRKEYAKARKDERFIVWHGVNVFECMHPVCGHEYMLMGMALDPDWIIDMCDVFTNLTLKCQQVLFEREGYPDGIWFYEDMGFKERPFMSPAMYNDIIKPFHKKTFDYAHSLGCKVIVHSCGYVEPLIPGLIDAGMDCLQAMEVKAGMDLLKIQKEYGSHIALMGGLDVLVLETNDLAKVDALIENKVKPALKNGGYIIYSDHSIPQSVEYNTYKYFLESARNCLSK